MKIPGRNRGTVAALLAASMVVAFDGCTASKTLSSSADQPKKVYKYQDMSTGKSFFQPIDPDSKQ